MSFHIILLTHIKVSKSPDIIKKGNLEYYSLGELSSQLIRWAILNSVSLIKANILFH